jgi:nitrous oxidase accessory protein NosD
MPRGKYGYGSGISANGDRIEIVDNKISDGNSFQFNGKFLNITDNSLASPLQVAGSNQTIVGNSIRGELKSQGSFNMITNNTIRDDISLNGSYNLVIENTLRTMYLENSDSNFVSGNALNCLWIGWNGKPCFSNTVCKNRMTGPGHCGILMGAGSNNVFHDNFVSNYTDGYCIVIGLTHMTTGGNTYYHNILVDNEKENVCGNSVGQAGNFWDNGTVGNYWDDYEGTDNNLDGIGDVPFTVEGPAWDDRVDGLVGSVFGQDNFPLMAPFDISSVTVDLPEWASDLPFEPEESKPSESFPVVPVVAVAAVAAVAVVGAGLLLYFKKRKH